MLYKRYEHKKLPVILLKADYRKKRNTFKITTKEKKKQEKKTTERLASSVLYIAAPIPPGVLNVYTGMRIGSSPSPSGVKTNSRTPVFSVTKSVARY